MYTNSTEEEKKLLSYLQGGMNKAVMENQKIDTCLCPKCKKGRIITQIKRNTPTDDIRQVCNACGESFNLIKMETDIYCHTYFEKADCIQTIKGPVRVYINGKSVPFHHRIETFDHFQKQSEPAITMDIIDVDVSSLKQGDFVFCGMKESSLDMNSTDEHSILYSYENDDVLLGFCGYDTLDGDPHDYCYASRIAELTASGFEYDIVSDPKEYSEKQHYSSKTITLATACIRKTDYKDAEFALFLALTSVVG